MRHLNAIDNAIAALDRGMRASFGVSPTPTRADPAAGLHEAPMSEAERRLSVQLLRVDHAGEIAAQALYEGQALTARSPELRAHLRHSANEEADHLAWCAGRLQDLGGHTSYLGPLWYAGSMALGALAGRAGDRISLGFLAETEAQVTRHLEAHLQALPKQDQRSRAVLEQMKADEQAHESEALDRGGAALPRPVQQLMTLTSKLMTVGARWI